MSGRVVRTRTGLSVKLGKTLGQGGEGEVVLTGGGAEVAKIYWPPKRSPALLRKLELMVSRPPRDPMKGQGFLSLAWPTQTLFDGSGAFVGFLMPRLDTRRCRPLHQIYRASSYPAGIDWALLVRTARNLASVVAAVHGEGYVVGDLNESNVLAATNTVVTLVDCDSMQVPDPSRGAVYRCAVGKPEYTPPELHGTDFSTVDRSPSADLFALAALICQLLVRGRHPFAGGPGLTISDNIRAGETFFVNGFSTAPGDMPPQDFLPPPMEGLFHRAFVEGKREPGRRPSALDWQRALDDLLARMSSCSRVASHKYSHHLSKCPWCVFEAKFGRPAFPQRPGRQAARNRRRPAARAASLPVPSPPQFSSPPITGPSPGQRSASPRHTVGNWIPRAVRRTTPGFILLVLFCILLLFAIQLLPGDGSSAPPEPPPESVASDPVPRPSLPPAEPLLPETLRQTRENRSRPDAWLQLAAALDRSGEPAAASAARDLSGLLGSEIRASVEWEVPESLVALLARTGLKDDEWIGDEADRAESEGRTESAQALYYIAHHLDFDDREWLRKIEPRRGLRVQRGIDWDGAKYAAQDGSPGEVGTIIAVPPETRPGWVIVDWAAGAGQNWYRWGDGKFDLALAGEPAVEL